MTTKGTCWVLAKTGAERSVDDFVSLRTAMKYYDNLAKRKRRLKKKVKVPLVVIFLLIFYSCSGTVWRMHWSILVYVRGYSHDANFNFCFTWQEWSLSFFLLIDSKRFQRGDLNKNENQIEVTLPGPPAPGATGLFHHIFVFILLLYSIVWKTHRRRSHVCAIFQACCAIFLPVDTISIFFLHFAVKIYI